MATAAEIFAFGSARGADPRSFSGLPYSVRTMRKTVELKHRRGKDTRGFYQLRKQTIFCKGC